MLLGRLRQEDYRSPGIPGIQRNFAKTTLFKNKATKNHKLVL
jgi:hypothetical protein